VLIHSLAIREIEFALNSKTQLKHIVFVKIRIMHCVILTNSSLTKTYTEFDRVRSFMKRKENIVFMHKHM